MKFNRQKFHLDFLKYRRDREIEQKRTIYLTEMANDLGVSRTTLHRIINIGHKPNFKNLATISRKMGKTVDDYISHI